MGVHNMLRGMLGASTTASLVIQTMPLGPAKLPNVNNMRIIITGRRTHIMVIGATDRNVSAKRNAAGARGYQTTKSNSTVPTK
jgi:hypothetical protein